MNKIIYYIDVLLAHNVSEEFTYKHETIEKPRVGMIVLAPLRSGEKIGVITRLLKENAVDCLLNSGQTNVSEEQINKKIKQTVSSKKEIDFQ